MDDQTKGISELSFDTQQIENHLRKAEVGALVTFAELSDLIGRNVQTVARHNLMAAIRRVERNDQMIFESVRGKGYKLLSDEEIATSIGTSAVDRTRRATRRAMQRLSCVKDFDSLPRDTRIRHQADMSVLAAMNQITKRNSMKLLESKVTEAQQQLPVGRTLQAFIS